MSIRTFVAGLFSCPRCVTLVGDVLRLQDQRDRARRSLGGAHAIVSDLLTEVLRLRAQNECQRANVGFSRRMAEELRKELANERTATAETLAGAEEDRRKLTAENAGLRIELKTWQDGARMAPAHFDQNSRLAEANKRACALLDAVTLNLQRGTLALPQDQDRLHRASGLLRLARLSSSPLPPEDEDFAAPDKACPGSSITGAACVLPRGHAADSATRFHRYPPPVKS